MKIIICSESLSKVRYLHLGKWFRIFFVFFILGLPLTTGFYGGHQLAAYRWADNILTVDVAKKWSEDLAKQEVELAEAKDLANAKLNAITLRMSQLQARLVRLDALGERLIDMAKLDEGEFDFNQPPALGGPETTNLGDVYQPPEFMKAVDQLAEQIENREQQLDTLDALLSQRELQDSTFVAGRPVKKGWMSSHYGRRIDPFSGSAAWHSGVDFAGKPGSEIVAVAAGVVVESGERSGYGDMVEINHGSGFRTRYAHNKENIVKAGDVVEKGQVIALMGNSGRSTGPHVHFEVYKNGRAVDPSSYINRTR